MPESLRTPVKIDAARSKLRQAELSLSSWQNGQLTQAAASVDSLRTSVRDLESQLSALEQEVRGAHVYAPIDGRVTQAVPLNVGDAVMAGSELLRIVPDDGSGLRATLVVDAAHIARVRTGQEAKLRFPGLPPSQFGQLSSYVSLIPADMAVVNDMPVFELEADIPRPYLLSSAGERIFLRPGINAEARIVIARGSVLRMMLRKLDFVQ